MGNVEHSVDVTAETLYEAVASALATLQQDAWVGELPQGLNTVSVQVHQPPVKHEVKMQDFLSWLGRKGGSPAEMMLRERVARLLGREPTRTV
jgi:LysM repeat protein